jgi:hypothetical protein
MGTITSKRKGIRIKKGRMSKKQIESVQTQQLQQLVEAQNFPLTIGISSGLAAAVTGFVVKWLFEQVVKAYQVKIADLGRSIERLDHSIMIATQKNEQLRMELAEFKCQIAEEYLSREDWIRTSVTLENKIDRLGQKVDDKLDRLLERMQQKN